MAKKILIVDDDADVAGAARTVLEDAGYEVIRAEDGAEGLETAQREKPDLILLDVMMPVVDGFEFNARRNGSTGLADIPVVVFTAFGQDITELAPGGKEAVDCGFADHIEKPFEPNALLTRIERILGQ
jgi:CheY-like chemotaxis protein